MRASQSKRTTIYGRERLCRYGARPPFSLERLRRLCDGRVACRIKKLRGGREKLRIMTSLELLARLVAVVPPPRYPLVRYHGVLSPRERVAARDRPEATRVRDGQAAARGRRGVRRQALERERVEMTVIGVRNELIGRYERRGYRDTGERRAFVQGPHIVPLRGDLGFVVLRKTTGALDVDGALPSQPSR